MTPEEVKLFHETLARSVSFREDDYIRLKEKEKMLDKLLTIIKVASQHDPFSSEINIKISRIDMIGKDTWPEIVEKAFNLKYKKTA